MGPGPVFNAELIRAARRPRYHAARAGYALAVLLVLALGYGRLAADGSLRVTAPLAPERATRFARDMFFDLAVLQLAAVLLLTPALVAGTLASERQRRTLGFLLASRLGGAEIVLGKLLARLLHVGVFLAVGLPIASLLALMGGIDPWLVLAVYAGTASTALLVASVSILVSTLSRKARDAALTAYTIELAWLLLPPILLFSRRHLGLGPALDPLLDGANVSNPLTLALLWSEPWRGRSGLAGSFEWMVGSQLIGGLACVGLAVVALRPASRRDEGSGWLGRRRARRRRGIGDAPMLWKECLVRPPAESSRLSGRLAVAAGVLALGYGLWVYGGPAFAELARDGWAARGVGRWEFNRFVRTVGPALYVLFALSITVRTAGSIAGEHEEDTWSSLTATDLTAGEIVGAKMLGAAWRSRGLGLALLAVWMLGLAAGSLHPAGFVAVVVETAAFGWFFAALGVRVSLACRQSGRALAWAVGIVLFSNGGYLFCCAPLVAGEPLVAVGCTPLVESMSLVTFEEAEQWARQESNPSGASSAFWLGITSVVIHGLAAAVLTLASLVDFDATVGRPRRPASWARERALPGLEAGDEPDA